MVAQARTRFYREFLTPALHRRFTRAAGVICFLCYIEAVLIGGTSSFLWSWFPLGPAGIRTLLLFISSLLIFVLRVAQLHFGARITASPFETFRQYLFRVNTLQTLGFYLFSAWWFTEVYIWSSSDLANLRWVTEGKYYERSRLNERPIYLRSILYMLAIVQSFFHLYYDYDEINLPCVKGWPNAVKTEKKGLRSATPLLIQFRTVVPSLLKNSMARALFMSMAGPILYALFLRRTAWSWTLFSARLIWDLPKASEPTTIPPYHISLILRSATSGFLLVVLWEFSNAAFSSFVAQEPLKSGEPLTSESRDPNGSLLNGLNSRKEVSKKFAFWELYLISSQSELRRMSIFSDIDRAGGATWTQVMQACLAMIEGVRNRISDFENPQPAPTQQQQQPNVQSLPRLSAPLRQESVLTNSPAPTNSRERIESTVGTVTKSLGQSRPSQQPTLSLSPRAKKYLGVARDRLLTQKQQEAVSPAGFTATVNYYLMQFLRSQFGGPFRQTYRRRVCAVVLGTRYSDLVAIVDAVESLTCLAEASLKEDPFGIVCKDVPLLVRTFVNSITGTRAFAQRLAIHWTDVDFDERSAGGREVEDVEIVVEALRKGLRTLLTSFGNYAFDIGLGVGEVNLARRVAGMEDGG